MLTPQAGSETMSQMFGMLQSPEMLQSPSPVRTTAITMPSFIKPEAGAIE